MADQNQPTPPKKGRPKQRSLKEIKPNPVGRPKGTKAIIDEYVLRMLNSPKSAKVLEAVFDAALDSENKNQAAAWKLIMDRVAPISAFDLNNKQGGGVPQISISISGLTSPSVDIDPVEDVTDVEDLNNDQS